MLGCSRFFLSVSFFFGGIWVSFGLSYAGLLSVRFFFCSVACVRYFFWHVLILAKCFSLSALWVCPFFASLYSGFAYLLFHCFRFLCCIGGFCVGLAVFSVRSFLKRLFL